MLQLPLSRQSAHMLRVPAGQITHYTDGDPMLFHHLLGLVANHKSLRASWQLGGYVAVRKNVWLDAKHSGPSNLAEREGCTERTSGGNDCRGAEWKVAAEAQKR